MANKVYACPVCNKMYSDLSELAGCIHKHETEEKAKKAEALKKAREIQMLQDKYSDAIVKARKSVEDNYGLLKKAVDTYNTIVAEAAQKADVYEQTASTSLRFDGFKKYEAPNKTASISLDEWLTKLGKASQDLKKEIAQNKKTNDLADIIFKNLGF